VAIGAVSGVGGMRAMGRMRLGAGGQIMGGPGLIGGGRRGLGQDLDWMHPLTPEVSSSAAIPCSRSIRPRAAFNPSSKPPYDKREGRIDRDGSGQGGEGGRNYGGNSPGAKLTTKEREFRTRSSWCCSVRRKVYKEVRREGKNLKKKKRGKGRTGE
jgi:hypothetical protein